MKPPESEEQGAASWTRSLPKIVAAGVTILLGFIVADGVRNWAPADAPTIRSAPALDEEDDTPASFPHAAAPARPRTEEDECVGQANGPAVTEAQPLGDRARWLTSIDYPFASLKAGHEGVSGLVMTIDRHGIIASCEIAGSSGHPLLDAAACTTLQSRGRFEPAKDAVGCPVPVTFRQRVRWQIPSD